MIKNKDFKLIKKILIILMPMISAVCIMIGIYSTEISVFLFGNQFVGAGLILQLLLPLIVLGLPNYLLGFPTLTPLGLSHFANKSTIAGAVIQLCGLLILHIFGILNVYSIIILSVITEFFGVTI